MLSFQTHGMWQLERVVTLSGALSVKGHLPVADDLVWSHGVRNSEVPLYM